MPASQRGFGLVELMVGITVGMIVAAGASIVAVNQINEHRRLMLETQVQQDLRAAADLLQQDLRRAGFRGDAEKGVWAPPAVVGTLKEQAASVATPNNYTDFQVQDDGAERSLRYSYARVDPDTGSFSPAGVPQDAEHFGFKWDKGEEKLSLQLGLKSDGSPNWQPITDPQSVKITDFDFTVTSQSTTDMGDFCEKACGTGGAPACPVHTVRRVHFRMVAQAAHDTKVKRTLEGDERLRADVVTGTCPS